MSEIQIALGLSLLGCLLIILRLTFWLFGGGQSFGGWFRHSLLRQPRNVTNEVQKSALGSLGVANLPLDVALVAGIGKSREAPQTIGDRFLRPTIGLRMISLVLSGLVLWGLWLGPAEFRLPVPALQWGLSALLVYGVFFIQTYEARYDDYRIVTRGWFFQRKEVLWKDVISLRDNGHYIYNLHTEAGKKYEVQKYLVGIVDFVAYANTRIARNNSEF